MSEKFNMDVEKMPRDNEAVIQPTPDSEAGKQLANDWDNDKKLELVEKSIQSIQNKLGRELSPEEQIDFYRLADLNGGDSLIKFKKNLKKAELLTIPEVEEETWLNKKLGLIGRIKDLLKTQQAWHEDEQVALMNSVAKDNYQEIDHYALSRFVKAQKQEKIADTAKAKLAAQMAKNYWQERVKEAQEMSTNLNEEFARKMVEIENIDLNEVQEIVLNQALTDVTSLEPKTTKARIKEMEDFLEEKHESMLKLRKADLVDAAKAVQANHFENDLLREVVVYGKDLEQVVIPAVPQKEPWEQKKDNLASEIAEIKGREHQDQHAYLAYTNDVKEDVYKDVEEEYLKKANEAREKMEEARTVFVKNKYKNQVAMFEQKALEVQKFRSDINEEMANKMVEIENIDLKKVSELILEQMELDISALEDKNIDKYVKELEAYLVEKYGNVNNLNKEEIAKAVKAVDQKYIEKDSLKELLLTEKKIARQQGLSKKEFKQGMKEGSQIARMNNRIEARDKQAEMATDFENLWQFIDEIETQIYEYMEIAPQENFLHYSKSKEFKALLKKLKPEYKKEVERALKLHLQLLKQAQKIEIPNFHKDVQLTKKEAKELRKSLSEQLTDTEKNFLDTVFVACGPNVTLDDAIKIAKKSLAVSDSEFNEMMADGEFEVALLKGDKLMKKNLEAKQDYFNILELMEENEQEIYQYLKMSEMEISQAKSLPAGFDDFLKSSEFKMYKKALSSSEKSNLKEAIKEYHSREKNLNRVPWRPSEVDRAQMLPNKKSRKIEEKEEVNTLEVAKEMFDEMNLTQIEQFVRDNYEYLDIDTPSERELERIDNLSDSDVTFRNLMKVYKEKQMQALENKLEKEGAIKKRKKGFFARLFGKK